MERILLFRNSLQQFSTAKKSICPTNLSRLQTSIQSPLTESIFLDSWRQRLINQLRLIHTSHGWLIDSKWFDNFLYRCKKCFLCANRAGFLSTWLIVWWTVFYFHQVGSALRWKSYILAYVVRKVDVFCRELRQKHFPSIRSYKLSSFDVENTQCNWTGKVEM